MGTSCPRGSPTSLPVRVTTPAEQAQAPLSSLLQQWAHQASRQGVCYACRCDGLCSSAMHGQQHRSAPLLRRAEREVTGRSWGVAGLNGSRLKDVSSHAVLAADAAEMICDGSRGHLDAAGLFDFYLSQLSLMLLLYTAVSWNFAGERRSMVIARRVCATSGLLFACPLHLIGGIVLCSGGAKKGFMLLALAFLFKSLLCFSFSLLPPPPRLPAERLRAPNALYHPIHLPQGAVFNFLSPPPDTFQESQLPARKLCMLLFLLPLAFILLFQSKSLLLFPIIIIIIITTITIILQQRRNQMMRASCLPRF
mmetsp:Transcript_30063/g.96636  ORF Transcript_30063/g.96636 Transcript_30063/m.96636 type:complete len:309 (+) Transcript_30063:532-1458(+)